MKAYMSSFGTDPRLYNGQSTMCENSNTYYIFRVFVLLLVAISFADSIQSTVARTPVKGIPAPVYVRSVDEFFLMEIKEYHVFNARAADSYVKVLFSTTTVVKDFKVLKLSECEIDDNGRISFHEETLYEQFELLPECPIMVIMTFFGSIPNNGFSYTDKDGTTRKFTVNLSGKDGRVEIEEY